MATNPATHVQPKVKVNEDASIDGLQAKFIDVKGIRTRYYDVGSGEPLVFCHGGLPGIASANNWSRNIPGLAKHFRVIAADKLASGLTDNPKSTEGYTLQTQVNHLHDFIRTLGLENIHLVGQSFGGYNATRITLEHPELVKSLVIIDSATTAPEVGDYNERRAKIFGPGVQPKDARGAIQHTQREMSYNPDHMTEEYVETNVYIRSLPKYKQIMEWCENGFEKQFLDSYMAQKEVMQVWLKEGRLQVPTLIYWAKNDPTAILEQGLALFNLLAPSHPHLRMIIVNRAGHFHFREYPEEFNRNVINFISGGV